MVYNAGQYQVKKELEVQQKNILSQVTKPTKKPILRWIFQKMSGIYRVHIPGQDSCLTGLNKEKYSAAGMAIWLFGENNFIGKTGCIRGLS
jgi:hypothetical protein